MYLCVLCLGTQNLELTAAKCDISEKSTAATTDSSNYYSSVENRPTIKDGSDVVYKVSKNPFHCNSKLLHGLYH